MTRTGAGPHGFWALLGVILAVSVAVAAGQAAQPKSASSVTRALTLYSVAKQEQYINNSDDRTRGEGKNPFGNYKDVSPTTSTGSAGPFPGDEALFAFTIYSDASLRTRAGSATFTCQYAFNKNAYCDASFEFGGSGTIIASGEFSFNATKFTLAVTGGSGRYGARTGVLQETPSTNHAQKLSFLLK